MNIQRNLILITIVFILSLVLQCNSVLSLRINEIELNPSGSDSGQEWIELYNNGQINLSGYILENGDGGVIELDESFNGYYVYEFQNQWLDNSDESVILKFNNSIVDEKLNIDDNEDDDKTWQYCEGEWVLNSETKNNENDCSEEGDNDGSGGDAGVDNKGDDEETYLRLSWDDDEIIINKEFEIKVKAYNLEDDVYDIKVWIEKSGDILNEVYDEEVDKWKSGNYYIDDFFNDKGDESREVKIRIKESERDWWGDAKIYVRLRLGSTTVYTHEEDIEILEAEEGDDSDGGEAIGDNEDYKISEIGDKESGNVISLGSKEEIGNKKDENTIIYKSKNEYIKQGVIYGFTVLCIIIIILLLIKGRK